MEFEIYFEDLKEETQQQLLEAMGIKNPSEVNWDVFPIATLETINQED